MFTRSYLLVLYLLFFFAIASLVSCSDDDVVNVDKYNDLLIPPFTMLTVHTKRQPERVVVQQRH